MISKNIVFLSYGSESEYLRAIFCILSLSAWIKQKESDPAEKYLRVIIYTDNPDFFSSRLPRDFPVVCFFLPPALLEEMLGSTRFFHRRKVAVIDLTFKRYPNEDLLFIDSDTFFTAGPAALLSEFKNGESFMHKREYRLEKGVKIFTAFNQGQYPKAFLHYISGREFNIRGTSVIFSQNDYSWNSGVLGLHKDFVHYMPDVFRLTDEFYANSAWFISEQLAFALILQRKTRIQPSDHFILHYWGKRQKALMDRLIINLFQERSPSELNDKEFIRSLTLKWKTMIINDLILEKAVISLQQGYWLYGTKKGLEIIIKDPFRSATYKELFNSIKSKDALR